jgi:hypothetical protein
MAVQRSAGNRATARLVQRTINLADHENAASPTRGHTLAQHVNVDNPYLKSRGKAQSTRFKDLATANAMADIAVADPKIAGKINTMKASGGAGPASGKVTAAENGIAYVQADDKFYGAKDILIETFPYKGTNEPLKTLGYYIQTMYPITSTGAAPT